MKIEVKWFSLGFFPVQKKKKKKDEQNWNWLWMVVLYLYVAQLKSRELSMVL